MGGGWRTRFRSTDVAEDKSVSHLWMVSWDGKEDIQLTYGKESAGGPRWSPDGRWLAFTSSREGAAKGSQVWVLDRRGGEAQQLTNVKEDLDGFRWSPDSKQLLLTLTEKEEPEDDKKDAKPKPPKPIVLDRYHFKQDVQGYLSDRRPHLFLFDVATKKLTKLTNGPVKGPTAFEEQGGGVESGWAGGCVCEQPIAAGSGPCERQRCVRGECETRFGAAQADDVYGT